MAAEWYCKVSGKTFGPVSAEQLKTLASQGKLTPRHEVRRGTDGSWVPADRVKGLFAKPSDATTAAAARSPEAQTPQTEAAVTPPDSREASKAAAPANPLGIIVDDESPTARIARRRKPGAGQKRKNVKWIVALAAAIVVLGIVVIMLPLGGDPEPAPEKRAAPKPPVQEPRSLEDIEAELEADEPLGTDLPEPSESDADDRSSGLEGKPDASE